MTNSTSVFGRAQRWWRHVLIIQDHRGGTDTREPEEIRGAACAALAAGTALTVEVDRYRWPLAHVALAAGATLRDVAEAAGMGTADLVAQFRPWVDQEHQAGRISGDEYAQLLKALTSSSGDHHD